MMTTTRRPSPSRYVTIEAEVDIADWLNDATAGDLHELGLHADSDCITNRDAAEDLYAAINALHQQAHPDQPIFADACLREPCRSVRLREHPQLSSARPDEL